MAKKTSRVHGMASSSRRISPSPATQASDVALPANRLHHRSIQHLPSILDSPSASVLPSDHNLTPTPDFLKIPNPLPPTHLPSHRDDFVSEAASSVSPGTVNVVGHDQINVTHIYNLSAEENVGQPGLSIKRNTEIISLEHPLFSKLSHVVEASFDASTPALRRACTENTRTAILEAIEEWSMDVTKPKIYWMNGMVGTGKTTIAYSISTILTSLKILGATFFCSRLVDECTKVDRIFPTIAYNLARNYPPFASTILKALKNDPDVAKRTINQQFTELVVKPMKASAKDLTGQTIVVVIDALDECANQAEVRNFLSVIFQRSSELPLKIFITSRPEQLVRVGFNRENPDSYSKLILHDIERDIVNADIKLYLAERLVDMVDGRSDFQESGDDWPPEHKVDVLTYRANGLFIFAKTICDYIGEPGGNISRRLDTALLSKDDSGEPGQVFGDALDTSELDKLYRDILDRAIPRRADDRDRLKQILSAVVSIRNPLSSRGLGALLRIDPGEIKSALGSLHAVISVPQSLDRPVSTFHASFPDCLADPTRSHQHYLSSSASHQALAKSCLSILNSTLKENICDLTEYPSNDTITGETIASHISEALAYACVYWASHLIATSKEEIQNADDVRILLVDFLRDHVLHWMECLSLLKQLHVAIESLRTIEGWVLNVYPEMSAMVTDARRFIVENFELICDDCLETYRSALVWLPAQSIIRKYYATRKLGLPIVLVGLRNAWGSCEKVLICGGVVNSVAFSGDGSHVVSGSSDKTVRIWNTMTGELEGVLGGHSDWVESVAFSNDGGRIASGSSDGVRIWNAVTGELESVFEGHSDWVNSIAFSNDGNRVVSGSSDKTVRIWNVMTGETESVFAGHSDSVESVALSSDGRYVVSGSRDTTVRLWNAVTGEPEGIFEGHSDPVLSVSLSDDGSHIVSGSRDKTIRIWNAMRGEEEGVLEGHSDWVHSVAFSSDGCLVVSGSGDETVQIWNVLTGESRGVFDGHSDLVLSVAISSDGNFVVSGSYDQTVRIWNALTCESEGLFEGHSKTVSCLAFSSGGSHIVSGSYDKTIRIWNAVTGEPEHIFRGHLGPVHSVAFSSDGCHVVSGSYDETVRVWDTATGELERVFKGHSKTVSCVAFSGDGSHVVSGSRDKTIRIWNVVTGETESVCEGHLMTVRSVAFSSDGRRVVSGSGDKTIRIWNVVTGEEEDVYTGQSDWVTTVAFLSDDSLVMTRSGEGIVQIWDTATGESVLQSSRLKIQYLPSGQFTISTAAYDHPTSCFLSDDEAWIRTDSSQRYYWIPQRYRGFTSTCSCGLKISFGYPSGSVVVLDLA